MVNSPNSLYPMALHYTAPVFYAFSGAGKNLRLDLRQNNRMPVDAAADAVLAITRVK